MPEPKLRYYLHRKVASTGHRSNYLSVGFRETHLAVQKACQRLADDGLLSNATLVPIRKAAVAALPGTAAPGLAALASCKALPPLQQPMRALLADWQRDHAAHLAKAYLVRSKQYVDWMEKFGPAVTPAAVTDKWARQYTS